MKGFITVFLVGCIAFVIATKTSVSNQNTPSASEPLPSAATAVANVNIPSEADVSDLKREARQLAFDIPFQPSPQDQFKPQDDSPRNPLSLSSSGSEKDHPEDLEGPPGKRIHDDDDRPSSKRRDDDDDEFEGRQLSGPSLDLQSPKGKQLPLPHREYEDDANNTIDTASSGHYGHQIHGHGESFTPSYGHGNEHEHEHGQEHRHGHGHHHHPPSHKPLKQSVVHRDPHAHFNEYDAIRTQDQDRHHQVYPSSGFNKHGSGHAHSHGVYGQSHGGYEKPHITPYHYDPHIAPECAHKNRYYYNLTFCLEDSHYPSESILWAIQQSGHYAQKLLSDITYQSADNTVDGLTRAEEEGYTYSHYFGGSHQQHHHMDKYKPPYTGYSYSHEYYKKGGYICPSNIYYARPRRAMNTYGKWKVIVNLDYHPGSTHGHNHGSSYGHGHGHNKHPSYTQTLRLEHCVYANAPCSFIDSHVHSRCLQKHNFVRLLSWTYEEGLHIDTFKMPIACSCHIKQPVHFYQPETPHHHHHHPLPHHPSSPVHPISHPSHHYSRGKK